MNPQDPLANLHALREPALINWWPMAPGWWALIALLLLALAVGGYYLIKHYRAKAYRRLAVNQLQIIGESFTQGKTNTQTTLIRTNALLKSVALLSFPRRDTAALSGEPWLTFLNNTQRGTAAFPPEFESALYQRDTQGFDTQRLLELSRRWVIKHKAAL